MIHDLIGKRIDLWKFNLDDGDIYIIAEKHGFYKFFYVKDENEDVSLKTSWPAQYFFSKQILRDVQHTYFFDEDSLTTNEKYVFIFEQGNDLVIEWDIHYKNKDYVHPVDFTEI